MKKDMLIIGYGRVSGESQRKSLYNQKKKVKLFIDIHNVKAHKIYTEVSSGGHQPQLKEMIKFIEEQYQQNKYKRYLIVATESSRIFRGGDIAKKLHHLITQLDIKIHFIDEQLTHERIIEAKELHYNAQQRKKIAEATTEGRSNKLRAGKSLDHRKPMGYGKNYAIIEEQANIIRRLFKQYLKNKSLRDVIKWTTRKNMTTASGNTFSPNTLSKILNNKAYIGVYKYGSFEQEAHHEPIISKKLFFKVQELMNTRNKRNKS